MLGTAQPAGRVERSDPLRRRVIVLARPNSRRSFTVRCGFFERWQDFSKAMGFARAQPNATGWTAADPRARRDILAPVEFHIDWIGGKECR